MMMNIKKEKALSSLIHQKINKAAFISEEDDDTKTFKYNLSYSLSKYTNEKFIAIKGICIKIWQSIRLKLDKVDWAKARWALSLWLINTFVEGVIVNFSVWGLFRWRFDLITIMAWGFAVDRLLNIYWRLKINGSTTKLPEKHE